VSIRPFAAILLAAAAAGAAPSGLGSRLGSISEELAATSAETTPANPRAGALTNTIRGSINLGESWTIDAGFAYTVNRGTPAPAGSKFADSGGTAAMVSLGAELGPDDHWTFALSAELSPSSTTNSGTQLSFASSSIAGLPIDTVADARLRSQSWSAGAGLSIDYDTAGDSDLEWAFHAGLELQHLGTTQAVTAIQGRSGVVLTNAAIASFCAAHKNACPKALRAALQEQGYRLDSGQLTLGATATLWGSTDVGLTVDAWVYSEDPTQVGYFSIAAGHASVSGGLGLPIAPMRSDVGLDLAHRIDNLSARLTLRAGRYVEGDGGSTYSASLKLSARLGHAWRLWLSLGARRDVDEGGDASVSKSAALGLAWKF
jgi:hypothetical protein